jgi:hypothetical protein
MKRVGDKQYLINTLYKAYLFLILYEINYLLPTLLHYAVSVRSFLLESSLRQVSVLGLGPQKQILVNYQIYTSHHIIRFTVLSNLPFEHKLGCKEANDTELG